jgi:hypothetical protein
MSAPDVNLLLQTRKDEIPMPGLALPNDAQDMMEFARETRRELAEFRFSSDAIIATNDQGKFVHMTFRLLRKQMKQRQLDTAAASPAETVEPE